ncbi:MAG: flagellar FliJ family protein [Alphaproteobacteria bacterium]|nr:flagellar FliJ family protein [Alphaproteobacteria bacterium]OJV12028.1 MAG: hypothetical protein BGO27_00380 [Alphaproteobacteria bacterium 33-17]
MPKSLKTLIRLHKNDIDKQIEIIGKINLHLERLNAALNHLKTQMEEEMAVTIYGFADIATSYMATNIERQEMLKNEIVKIEESLAREQEILRLLFESKKKYEIIEEKQIAEKMAKIERLEQANLDEINLRPK